MTESEWLNCTNYETMLEFLKGKASDRKLRLFVCACCRLAWDTLMPGRSRQAVEIAERYADGLASELDVHRARSKACEAAVRHRPHTFMRPPNPIPATIAEGRLRLAGEAVHLHQPFLIGRICWHQKDDELNVDSPPLLRDIFGNPFRSTSAGPGWLTTTVNSLAVATYEERILPSGELEDARLAVLADALEEAGCDNADILNHLRGPGPHVRGCWPVDLLIGKG